MDTMNNWDTTLFLEIFPERMDTTDTMNNWDTTLFFEVFPTRLDTMDTMNKSHHYLT